MKIRNVFMTLGLALTATVGVAFGLNLKPESATAKAWGSAKYRGEGKGPYIVGSFTESGWSTFLPLEKDSSGDYVKVLTLEAGAEFKFTNQPSWGDIEIDRTWSQITSQQSWVDLTDKADGDSTNFKIKAAGTYRFYWEAAAIEGEWAEAEYGLHIMVNPSAHLLFAADNWVAKDENKIPYNFSTNQFELESVTLAEDDVFKVYVDSTDTWYGYSNMKAADGLSAKEKGQVSNDADDNIVVEVSGDYAFYVNTAEANPIWMQIAPASEVLDFSTRFLAAMATPCANENNDNKTAVSAIWSTWKTEFEGMTAGAKGLFGSSNNATVERARKLYVHIVGRYGLDAWNGAPAASFNSLSIFNVNSNNNVAMILIVVSALAIASIGGFFFVRRKRESK